MKKTITILIIALAFNVMGYVQKNEPKVRLGFLTANFNNPSYINGKLKSMTQITYKAKLVNGSVVKGEKLKTTEAISAGIQHITFNFNESGEMINAIYYDDNGAPYMMANIDYENGKISKISYTYNGTPRQYIKFIYDNIGLKETQYFSSENTRVAGETIYFWDKNGNLIKSENYSSAGAKYSESIFIRDSLGRILISTNKNGEGIITNRVEYSYGANWDPIAQDTKISNSQEVDIKGRRETVYDERGNTKSSTRYTNDEPVNITERTYIFYTE